MNSLARLAVVAATILLPARLSCQSGMFAGMRYLGEIGHLETDYDHRTSADLVIARAVSKNQDIHIEGMDDHGKRWTAAVQIRGGVGWTDAWIADFDGNSRRDLLIASSFPGNGRCVNPVHLTFLMIDSVGRPVPWSIETHWPKAAGAGKRPALLVDFNRSGRAELMATSCEYSPGPEVAEDRRIKGIYEARDAHWQLMRPADLSRYTALFRANYRHPGFVHLLAPAADAMDLGNQPPPGASPLTLKEALPPPPECATEPHVWIPPVVNGRLDMTARNPCEILQYIRLLFSDGSTCYSDGEMTVVIDRPDGREIVETESRKELERVLEPLVKQHAKIIPTGRLMAGKCSPAMLWASEQ